MWFPLALILGFALVFLALHLEGRRHTVREGEEAERGGIGPLREPAPVMLDEAVETRLERQGAL